MRYCIRHRAAVIALLILASSYGPVFGQAGRDALPQSTTISELLGDPHRFDGKRVEISGVIESLEVRRGRRGSPFVVILLHEGRRDPEKAPHAVTLVSFLMPGVEKGDSVVASGVYHHQGHQAGWSFEDFIDLETVSRKAQRFL